MVLATWWGWGPPPRSRSRSRSRLFGYSLTLIPLLRAGTALGAAVGIALVADTLSIVTMELVDNAVLLIGRRAHRRSRGRAVLDLTRDRARGRVGTDVPRQPRAHSARKGPCARACGPRPRALESGLPSSPRDAGSGSGVSTGSTCARRCSNAGGRISVSPRCAGSSSTEKPGPSVAISNRTPRRLAEVDRAEPEAVDDRRRVAARRGDALVPRLVVLHRRGPRDVMDRARAADAALAWRLVVRVQPAARRGRALPSVRPYGAKPSVSSSSRGSRRADAKARTPSNPWSASSARDLGMLADSGSSSRRDDELVRAGPPGSSKRRRRRRARPRGPPRSGGSPRSRARPPSRRATHRVHHPVAGRPGARRGTRRT